MPSNLLDYRMKLFADHPAEESNVRPFPRERNHPEVTKTADRISRQWRGMTLERALADYADKLYRDDIPFSAAVGELSRFEIAVEKQLERLAEVVQTSEDARRGKK